MSVPFGLISQAPSEPRANILLVDDDRGNLLGLRGILDDLGQNFVEATSGEEALRLLEKNECAVILLDVQMPGMNGFETAKLFRAQNQSSQTPIIFLTAYQSDEFPVEQAYSLGAVDYLVKPFSPVILKAKIAGLLNLYLEKRRAIREADQLRLLIHGTLDYAIFMLDSEGHVLTWNSGAERLKGYKAEEIIGQHFSRFYPAEVIERGWPQYELEVARTEGRFEDEGWRLRKDGARFWANVVITALRDEQGNLRGFSKVTRDLTGRRQAEEAVRQGEERFRLLVEGAKDYAIFLLDPKGHVASWNAGAERIKGYKANEIIGQHFSRFYPQDALDRGWPAHELRVAQAEGRFEDEGWRVRKDGTQFWANVVITAVHDGTGQLLGFSKITRDMTERMRAEENARRLLQEEVARRVAEENAGLIQQERERLHVTLTSIGDAVISTDAEGRVIFLNPIAENLVGWKSEDAAGKELYDVFHIVNENTRKEVENPAIRALKDGTIVGLANHTVLIARDGREWPIDDSAAPIRGKDGAILGAVLVFRDVTERRNAEDQLRRSEQRFARFMQHLPGLAWIKDLQGRYVYANDAAEKVFRMPRAKLYGKTDDEIFPSETATHFRQNDQEALSSGTGVQFVEALEQEDGVVHYSIVSKFPILESEGQVALVGGMAIDITEQRQAEEALREAERRWRNLAEALPNLVWTDLPDGQCDYLSSQWGVYTGIPESELLGLEWLERVLHPDDRQRTLACWMAAVEDKAVYDVEYRIRRHDGQFRWFKTRGVPIRDEQGKIVKWFGTCTDIEDQKQAIEQLRESEERFRQLADAMPQIAWTARPDGNIDYQNRRWHEFTGLPETSGNEGWKQILHPDDARTANERWAVSLQNGATFEMEMRLLDRRNQIYRWYLIRTVGVRDELGMIARWFGTGTDIHEQKRAAESSRYLAEASAALASVVDYESTLQKVANLAVPYFADWSALDIANNDGTMRRLAVAHKDAEKISIVHELMQQYPPDPQSPTGALAVLRSGKPEIVGQISDEMLIMGAKDERHLRLIRSLGLKSYICVPLIVSGNPLGVLTFATAESGRTYTDADLALATDLANRAAVAVENTQLYQALRDADRRKDEFLATLAHELRNPLAPIRNSLQILKMPRVDAETVERSREMMERQVHHLVRLVDDLLDVSRVMRGKIELRKERIELATIVARAVETVQPLLDAQGHNLSVVLPNESLLLDADPVRVAQVIGNLLTNAAKYTEASGRIGITANKEDNHVVLRIRDNGIGIAPDMLPHIFELFVQVDHAATRSQGGLGIGLTLVKNLVEMHQGKVEAYSGGLGKGSEFVVRLPLLAQVQPEPTEIDHRDHSREPAPSSGHRLLVVDDNNDAAVSLAMLLRLQGHEVQIANDGPSALELAASYHPRMVFLDIGMPGMDGYEVARRMRRTPGLESIVLTALTGWGQQEDRRRTAEAGFDHHLVKPAGLTAVESLLESLKQRPS